MEKEDGVLAPQNSGKEEIKFRVNTHFLFCFGISLIDFAYFSRKSFVWFNFLRGIYLMCHVLEKWHF